MCLLCSVCVQGAPHEHFLAGEDFQQQPQVPEVRDGADSTVVAHVLSSCYCVQAIVATAAGHKEAATLSCTVSACPYCLCCLQAAGPIHIPRVRLVSDYDLNKEAAEHHGPMIEGDMAAAPYLRHKEHQDMYDEHNAAEYDADDDDIKWLDSINSTVRQQHSTAAVSAGMLHKQTCQQQQQLIRTQQGGVCMNTWWLLAAGRMCQRLACVDGCVVL